MKTNLDIKHAEKSWFFIKFDSRTLSSFFGPLFVMLIISFFFTAIFNILGAYRKQQLPPTNPVNVSPEWVAVKRELGARDRLVSLK